MAVNIGPKIGIDGEAQYRKELNSIIQQAKTLASEMKAVTSAFDKNDNSQAKLTAQTRVLTQQIEVQQRRVEQLQKGLDAAAKKYGETDSRTLKWKQAVNDATAELNRMQAELKQTTNETDDLGDELESAGRQVSSLGDIIKGSFLGNLMADAVSNIVSELGNLVSEGAKAADALTKFRSTMDFAGYDAGTIEETADAMQDYASRTVYDLQTIANTTAQLAANSVPDFEALTEAAGNLNAVAGGNADTFQSVAMVLTQTAGAGKLTTENWNQLADAIPGASGVLQQAMLENGAYVGNFREAMENGEISAEEFNAAIMQLGQSDAAVQAAQSVSTIEGAVGNLQATVTDVITQLLANGGEEAITNVINALNSGLSQLGEWISANRGAILDFVTELSNGIISFGTFLYDNKDTIVASIEAIGIAIAAIKVAEFANGIAGLVTGATTLSSLLPGLGAAIAALTSPVGIVVAAIAALVGAIVVFGDTWKQYLQMADDFLQGVFAADMTDIFGPVLGGVLNGFLSVFKGIWDAIKGVLDGVIDIVKGVFTGDWSRAWDGVVEVFSGIVSGIASIFKGVLNAAISIVNGVVGGINLLISGINLIPGVNIPKIPSIPMLAKGGIVRSGSAIVGEAGPELMTVLGNRTIVQPLPARYATAPRGQAAGAAVMPQININVYGAEGQDENALAEIIMRKIQAATARKEDLWR